MKQTNDIQFEELISKNFEKKYKFMKKIGEGQFSQVLKCINQYQKFVAVKIIDLSKHSKLVISYMENEVEVLKTNKGNPNIIQLIEFAKTKQYLIIVMEYCQLNLKEMSEQYYNDKLPEDLVIIIMRQIVNGLFFLHQNKIIHRDLKLENFGVQLNNTKDEKMINKEDLKNATYKILDFGFSKNLQNLDHTRSFIGTPSNMAPELLRDQEYSFEADIYSLGCCLYQMVTSEFPFYGNGYSQLLQNITSEQISFEQIKNPILKDIIKRMLKQNAKERITWQELYETSLFKIHEDKLKNELFNQLQDNYSFYVSLSKQSRLKFKSQKKDQEDPELQLFIYWFNSYKLVTKIAKLVYGLREYIYSHISQLFSELNDKELISYANYFINFSNDIIRLLKQQKYQIEVNLNSNNQLSNLIKKIENQSNNYQELKLYSTDYIEKLFSLANYFTKEQQTQKFIQFVEYGQYPDFQQFQISQIKNIDIVLQKIQILQTQSTSLDINFYPQNELIELEYFFQNCEAYLTFFKRLQNEKNLDFDQFDKEQEKKLFNQKIQKNEDLYY